MKNEEQTTQNLLDRIVALQQRVRELEEREAQCREQTQALGQQLAQEQATRQTLEITLHQTEVALRQSEEHLKLANERFQLAATAVSAMIYDWDIESDTVERTEGLTRILGYSLTEAEPSSQWWRERVHPDDFQRVSAEAATALAKGDFYTGEYRILNKNNQYIHVLDQGLVVARNAQGNPARVIGSTTDISARKLAQEALRQSEQRLRLALEAARMVAWEWNLLEDTIVYSATAADVFGLLPGAKFESSAQAIALIHPDEIADRQQIVNSAIASSGSYVAQFRLIRPIDGAVVWMEERGSVICDRTDRAVKLTGMLMDITELKQAEAALRDSEALATARAKELEVFMEAVPAAVWIARDPQCHQVTANRTAYELVQLPSGSVATATPADGRYPFAFKIQREGQDIPLHELPMQQAGRTGQDVEAEFDFVFENGEVRSIYGRAVPLRDNLGEVRGVIGAFLDVSERKRAEAALRESEERFRQMAETIQDVFWITDFRAPQILYVSPAYEKIWGRNREEVYSNYTTWLDTIHPEDRAETQATALTCQDSDFVINEYRIVRPDGEIRWIRDRGFALRDETGQIYRVVGIAQDITDSKLAEAALRRSEAKFRRLVEANMFGVAIGDFNGNMVYANDALLDAIGYTREELDAGQIRWLELTPPEQVDLDWQAGEQLRQHGVCKPFEKEYIHKDGHRIPILIGGALLDEPYEQQEQMICFYLDLTELKQTEAALREQQLLLETILKQAADATIVCDASGTLTFANAAARRLARQDPDDMTVNLNLLDWGDAYDPNGNLIFIEDYEMSKALRGETSHAVESRMVRKDGSYYDILMSAAPLIDRGQIIGAVGTFMDITDRKRVEEALRESVERLNLALAASYMGDWSWDADTDVVTFSERAAEIFGIPSGPYMTWTQMRELLHEDDRDRARLMVEQAIRERGDYDIEYRVIRPDGVQCWVSAKGRGQYDASGQVLGMLGVVQDITERKYAEQALQESEATARARAQELEALMQITPVALWIAHDPNCHHMSANQTAYDLMRSPAGSVTTATPADGSYPLPFKQRRNDQEVAPHDLPMQRAARTGQEIQDELEFVFEDGTVRFIYGKAVPLRNDIGEVRGVIGAFVDITERKQAEREREQLLARERAAREEAQAVNRIKDEFLAVLSHELRSPLNPILGWTKLLQTRKFDEQATQRALSTIERNAKLQTQLIDDLLDVSRILRGKMDLKVYPVNLVAVIDAALETVRLAAEAKGIEIQTKLAPDIGQVSGDSNRLQQVVLNLVSNAVKFTPSGGRVEIHLERVGRDAQIQVTDTGKGIKPEFLPHVFEYFRQEDGKTTRQFGGLGLGLAIVRHLVELHGGTVQAESPGEGQGATFTVRLPLIAIAKEITQEDKPSIATSPLDRLQILVVDDIADMRDLLAMILEQYGATVRVAASAAEALIAIEQFKPDLLISDIGMSDIDGYMLLRQLRQLPPEQGGLIPAIALTAYASEFDHQQALTAGFQKHIPKPVEPEELVKAITALLVEK